MKIFSSLNIDFIGKRNAYYSVSLLMILASIGILIANHGPILGIDFTGGTSLQVGFKNIPPIEQVRSSLDRGGWKGFTLQSQPVNHAMIIRIKTGPEKTKSELGNQITQTLKKDFAGNVKDVPDRVEFVGPVIGKKLVLDTMWAILGSFVGIIIYVAFRFKKMIWGLMGVLALAHDVFITLGFLTFIKCELTIEVVAALLTLAGYSINDTIVVFDRIRENLGLSRKEESIQIFNRSINETMSRTINTQMTVLLASLCLVIWGGETIFGFAMALLFGGIVGTYSSVGVASALVYQWEYLKGK